MNRLLLRYKDFLERSSENFLHATAKHDAECKQGCFECCSTGLFDITLLDALYLQDAMTRIPVRARERITATANQQLDMLEEQNLFSRKNPFLKSVRAINALSRMSARLSCPALDEKGKCLIYNHRPHICRIFGPTIRGMRRKVWLNGCRHVSADIPVEDFGMADQYVEEIHMKHEFFRKMGVTSIPDMDTIMPAAIVLDLRKLLPDRI
ncbi:MAG: YkgJ family cysteine cluster protein [Nitrospiraceae bacterium]|nr:YkgJ family cysteine cluster protein [Nitrospiraceae bacterium]